MLYGEQEIIKRCTCSVMLGHLFRMQETYPCKKLIHHKPEGIRHVGKHRLRWLESVVEDQKNMDVRNWRHKSQD